VKSSSLQVFGGLSVKASGLTVYGLVSVMTKGMVVSAGLTVASSGVIVTGGLTIAQSGVVITGGTTLQNVGLSIKGGMTVDSLSGSVTSMTVKSGGILIADAGSLDVYSKGMLVSGGMTLWGSSSLQTGYSTFSDQRLKQNVTQLTNSLDMINQLRGVSYNWKNGDQLPYKFDNKKHIGMIAQEVQEVIPDVVESMGEDGSFLGLRYGELIPLVIEAIRDLDDCACLAENAMEVMAFLQDIESKVIQAEEENSILLNMISVLEGGAVKRN
jgi:hypothetical protein